MKDNETFHIWADEQSAEEALDFIHTENENMNGMEYPYTIQYLGEISDGIGGIKDTSDGTVFRYYL